MSNVVFWRQVFLGASLFLCGGYPIIAAEVGDLTPNVGTRSLQQDGRRVICAISDKAGPIVGANVLVKGTTIGNISDMDGRVILEGVPSNAILVVSYIGYVSQEIPLKSSQTNVRIQLVEDTQALDEVVVVGYGTQSKKDITGSVAVVATDELKETPVSNFAEALQGKAAGVFVQAGGGPLGETTIRIRGVGSVNGSDPLIIVDGVQGVDIDAVNANDIESMQILKDAAASAIYGAKGANGVIVITTIQVSYNGYFGVAKMANDGYGLLNAWEAMEFQEEGQRNLFNYRGGQTVNHAQFGYNITANISRYKNEVTRLGSSDLFNDTRLSKVNITTVGQPVGMFYGYQIEGIYQNEQDVISSGVLPYGVATENDLVASAWVGRYKMKDVNNDGKIDADDRTIIGNPHPDLTGGFNISLTWRDFDLSTYMYYSIGNDLYKHYEYYTMFGNLQSNYSKDRLAKSWDPVNNPNGIYPLWTTTSTEGPEAGNESNSNYVQDGSYLRMQTLTLGYSLPKKLLKKIGFEKIRVYGQISNVFTITGYDGLDPEVRSHTSFENEYVSSDMNKGIDYGSYGMPRQFLMGVNVTF